MLQHSWNQVCPLLKLNSCFLIHLFSPIFFFILCFKFEDSLYTCQDSQVIPKATNCMQLPPGQHLDILYFFAIKSFLRGDLEKVKKHLKKNDINSVDGQGRYIKKLSEQHHLIKSEFATTVFMLLTSFNTMSPLSLSLTSKLLYLYL